MFWLQTILSSSLTICWIKFVLYIFITPLSSKKGVQALGASFQLFCPWGPLWHSSDTESESGRGGGGREGGTNWIRIQSGSGHATVEKTFLNFRVRGACWYARLLLLRARQRRAQGLSHQVQTPLTLFPLSCFSDRKIFGDKMCLGGGASALRFKVTATCNTSRARSVSYPPPQFKEIVSRG